MPGVYDTYFALDPSKILHGQVWRILTFLMQSPNTSLIFFIFTLYLYYMIGTNLEQQWGSFRFNLYYLTGVLGTVLGSIIAYLVTGKIYYMDSYYINMALFLAFAVLYPNLQFYLFFVIPVKVKWLAWLDGAFFAYTIITGTIGTKIAAVLALANFLIYFASVYGQKYSPKQMHRKMAYQNAVKKTRPEPAKRKCAVCGRTEEDHPELEFRYCSKCNGNYMYCQEHLFTHEHIK